jgi:soluble lytic murein transglycosylase-like protein
MNRNAVLGLAICAALLASGKPELADQSRDSARADAEKSSSVSTQNSRFGVSDVARFLERANPALSANDVRRTSVAIVRNSRKYGLDPILVTQVLWVESGARPWVRSPLGAIGLMQVMPHMAEPMGLAGSLASIESNIEAGCLILSDNIRRLGEEDGISAYFWGSDIRGVAYLERVKNARAAVQGHSES